jgi:hypothetical protein
MVRQTAGSERYCRFVRPVPPTTCQSNKVNFASSILLNVSLSIVTSAEFSFKKGGFEVSTRKSKLRLK